MKELEMFIENDPEFGQEIITIFIKSLIEFRDSLTLAITQKDPAVFMNAHHKIKTTLSFSGNGKLQLQADTIFENISENGISGVDTRLVNAFGRQCTNSIKKLESRLVGFKTIL